MALPYSVFLVLGAAAPARAVAHISYLSLSEYGNAVLSSGLWRPAMEAGSHSGIARLVQQSLGTSALFPSYYVFVIYYTTHKKSLRSQQHPASAFTAAIKKIRHGQDKHRQAKHHKQTPHNITPHIHL
jgi:hypothetical protein